MPSSRDPRLRHQNRLVVKPSQTNLGIRIVQNAWKKHFWNKSIDVPDKIDENLENQDALASWLKVPQ
jgi:hypothetical protein